MQQALAQQVWDRANSICEYCRMPQQYDRLTFEVDHIISEKLGGPTVAQNLSLSCFGCNRYKSALISGIDPDGDPTEPVRLFNPRRDNWDDHFYWDGPELRGRTDIGRTTVATLRINLPHRVELRRWLIAEGVFPPA